MADALPFFDFKNLTFSEQNGHVILSMEYEYPKIGPLFSTCLIKGMNSVEKFKLTKYLKDKNAQLYWKYETTDYNNIELRIYDND